MSEPTVLLEVRDLSVHYRRRRSMIHAVDGVSLVVRRGETVGLVGESGSGKSTIARAALGLVPVQTGSILFGGADITHLTFKRRREYYRDLQLVFQDPYSSLNPSRTVGSTLAEPLQAFGVGDRAAVRARIAAVLEQVRLSPEAAARYPHQFSGGQRQRIAIARALVLAPQLIVLDEPTSALDLSVQAQILNLLQELQQTLGLSYLFISHDLDVVRHFCDEVYVLYRGQVMEIGPPGKVADAPAHPYAQVLHDASPLPNPRLQRERRTLQLPLARAQPSESPGGGCPFVARCLHAEPRCRTERPALRPSDHGLVACHRFPEWRADARPGGE